MERANGWRYPLVGGTRQRHFDGTTFKPRKLLENAPTPTCQLLAVLGGFCKAVLNLNIILLLRPRGRECFCASGKGFANQIF